ncbi:hypothetical protein GFS03_04320 [Sulfolobus sp. E5-1-F]|uniref:hypothetical protein n=1 Tax=Sulfolobaceae TaxID=118883 RepID=UPI0012964C2D|nr:MULTISPECIES: hypothetical protein [unclassified Sulfolobus]QGA53857.1 hypothetical protein GFS03_04320 [Sulfolobus sp. E5-1-F]QGA69086.1 hypothetical protein GFS33_10580 [Sulfolobus sp. E11-6]
MRLQIKGKYVYVTMWDKQLKKPRRFYLCSVDNLEKYKTIIEFAKKLKVTKEELEDYLNFYVDKEYNLTKFDYVLMSLVFGEMLWSGESKKQSEKELKS